MCLRAGTGSAVEEGKLEELYLYSVFNASVVEVP